MKSVLPLSEPLGISLNVLLMISRALRAEVKRNQRRRHEISAM